MADDPDTVDKTSTEPRLAELHDRGIIFGQCLGNLVADTLVAPSCAMIKVRSHEKEVWRIYMCLKSIILSYASFV